MAPAKAVGPGIDQLDRGIARQLLARLGQDVERRLVVVAEQAMRVAGKAIARQAGIENRDLAAGAAELQRTGEAGKAAADDDDVIHGVGSVMVRMKGVGRGLAGDIVERNALQPRRQQRLGIGDELAHHSIDRADDAAGDIARIALGADQQAFAHGGIDRREG